jgi:lipase maturation factor
VLTPPAAEMPSGLPLARFFGPGVVADVRDGGVLWPRWVFLRCLGLIFFSAFYSLAFQIKGLIGTVGVLPAAAYLEDVARLLPGLSRFYEVPTVLWLGSGNGALTALVWVGLIASVLLVCNVWPRGTIAICVAAFLSFISAAQDFSSYQSDGMLLEAGFLCLFFAPQGFRPGLGADRPPSRASLFLLRWEWFRIYFESGVVKLLSGEPQWRNLTAMDRYYENGPLPTWIGWYTQQRLSHTFHATTALVTLAVELVLVWMAWLPRPFRLACFGLVTLLQVGIILTANYAFLNYLVLVLGFLLLDDVVFARLGARLGLRVPQAAVVRPAPQWRIATAAAMLTLLFLATVTAYLGSPLSAPAGLLAPFRIANRYGLFAVMTRGRYEIEFQGSRDGRTWIAYPFRYKPQDLREAPGIYAPYQPRFEWNLWFASLGSWRQYPWVASAEVRLLEGSRDVLALFRRDPFAGSPPRLVRAVRWQYWFTTPAEKRRTGCWWRREPRGLYAPVVERQPDGTISVLDSPAPL